MNKIQELGKLYQEKFTPEVFNFEPKTLYEPVMHIMSLPGKRIRPLLLLLSCDLFGGDSNIALNPAHAMEVFHNFTLVHDDIMDEADIRRGAPTVHKKFGLNAGILAGDVMLSYAYKFLTSIPVVFLENVLAVFNQTSIEIYEGQQMDVDFESRLDVSVEEYLKMIQYKTSVLLGCSLQIGAILGNASSADQQKIYDFGINLGLSFQINDDWLDTFGEGEKVGKRIGGDILQNKKTILLITALKDASKEDRLKLVNSLAEQDEEKKIAHVMEVFETCKISEKIKIISEKYYQAALQNLEELTISPEKKSIFIELAKSIHQREF